MSETTASYAQGRRILDAWSVPAAVRDRFFADNYLSLMGG